MIHAHLESKLDSCSFRIKTWLRLTVVFLFQRLVDPIAVKLILKLKMKVLKKCWKKYESKPFSVMRSLRPAIFYLCFPSPLPVRGDFGLHTRPVQVSLLILIIRPTACHTQNILHAPQRVHSKKYTILALLGVARGQKNIISRETKELSLCNKPNTHIFSTWWCKPLIFQTQIFSSNRIQSLKYLRSTVLGYTDIRIRKSEFVAKTQFLSIVDFDCSHLYKYFSNIWVKSRPSLEN